MAVMHASSSNQLISEGLNPLNFIADNQFTPIASISTSSAFPTITLDLTHNQLQPQHLAAGSFDQHSSPLSSDMRQVLDHNESGNDSSIVQDYVASLKADPNFTAALSVAIAGSMLNLGDPVQGMPKFPLARQSFV